MPSCKSCDQTLNDVGSRRTRTTQSTWWSFWHTLRKLKLLLPAKPGHHCSPLPIARCWALDWLDVASVSCPSSGSLLDTQHIPHQRWDTGKSNCCEAKNLPTLIPMAGMARTCTLHWIASIVCRRKVVALGNNQRWSRASSTSRENPDQTPWRRNQRTGARSKNTRLPSSVFRPARAA